MKNEIHKAAIKLIQIQSVVKYYAKFENEEIKEMVTKDIDDVINILVELESEDEE